MNSLCLSGKLLLLENIQSATVYVSRNWAFQWYLFTTNAFLCYWCSCNMYLFVLGVKWTFNNKNPQKTLMMHWEKSNKQKIAFNIVLFQNHAKEITKCT